jgi:5-methylthioadenosine/S-adenosylhomocysteine deaminase
VTPAAPWSSRRGSTNAYLLKGTLLLPGGPSEGELLIAGNLITCVGASCSGEPGASGATVIETNGVISAGIIDPHNHTLFNIFDEDDWTPDQTYLNHNQWADNDETYSAVVDAKQYLNGETSALELGCELNKYGEARAIMAGTTSVQGSLGATGKACWRTLARSIDVQYNGLPDDLMRTAISVPSTESAANGVCDDLASGDATAYVVHVAEGVDQTSRNEFTTLGTRSNPDGCLYHTHTSIIHGTALDDAQLATMGANDMDLIWSPKSNIFLYGAGTDLSKTTNIPEALQQGLNVAIGPDWTLGGSQNMLDELRYADMVDDAEFGDLLDERDLVEMATINGAIALGVEPYLGSLEEGKRADVAVFLPSTGSEYGAVLDASPREVTLVFVDGRLVYGDADFLSVTASDSVCEELDVCCRQKFICTGQTGFPASDRLDQTLSQITQILSDALADYDASDIDQSQWDFSPLSPLVKCP